MSTLACPHCGILNDAGGSFCVSCGRALPGAPAGPRIVESAGVAATHLGQQLQSEELAKQSRKAFGALLLVAILQVVVGTLIILATNSPAVREQLGEADVTLVAIIVYAVGAIFLGLAFWARRSPFPAAITGLVIFVTLHLLEALANPAAICQGVIIKVVVIVVLVRAISAGARHRALIRQVKQGM